MNKTQTQLHAYYCMIIMTTHKLRHSVAHMVLVMWGKVSKTHHGMTGIQLPIKAHAFEKLTLGFEQLFTMDLF